MSRQCRHISVTVRTSEVRIERVADGAAVCERCTLAETHLRRARGLLGRARLEPGEGLLLRPAGSIHTHFMRFPIDAVFLDPDLVVVDVAAGLRPWRIAARKGANAVLELAAGECRARGIRPGDALRLVHAA